MGYYTLNNFRYRNPMVSSKGWIQPRVCCLYTLDTTSMFMGARKNN